MSNAHSVVQGSAGGTALRRKPDTALLFESGSFWLLGARRRGASHALSGKPCQDAFQARIVWRGGQPHGVALVVADGHGSERHDRSDTGARLAAGCGVDLLRAKLRIMWAADDTAARTSIPRWFREEYPRILVRKWREAVLSDSRQRQSAASDLPCAVPCTPKEQDTFERYGTTVIVGLLTANSCMVGQIGDGDAVLLRETGPEELTKPDQAMVGTSTWSLCSLTPDRYWQVQSVPASASDILMLSTDGLSDSFADRQGFLAFGRDLFRLLNQDGRQEIKRLLPQWLDVYSRDGSGDDITVGLASATTLATEGAFRECAP